MPRRPKVRDHDAWPVAGVLVASLVLGIFFGTSGVAMLAADPLRALLGGASDTSEDTFDLVLGTAVPAGEEELL